MNEVTLSGVIKGSFEKVGNDGVMFQVVTRAQRGDENDEFTALAYGESANFLNQHSKSGQRIVVQGRLSSEKLGTEQYHTAVTVTRVLAISDSSVGMDYSYAVISGNARTEGLKYLPKGTPLVNLNVTNTRSYTNKEKEQKTYTTYIGATLWSDRAEAFSSTLDGQDLDNVPLVFDGILKPRSYNDKEGNSIRKIDVWVNNVSVGTTPVEPREETAQVEAPRRESTRSKSVDDLPF